MSTRLLTVALGLSAAVLAGCGGSNASTSAQSKSEPTGDQARARAIKACSIWAPAYDKQQQAVRSVSGLSSEELEQLTKDAYALDEAYMAAVDEAAGHAAAAASEDERWSVLNAELHEGFKANPDVVDAECDKADA